MKLTHTMLIMFIGSFFIQYFLMPPIMVSENMYITNNIGKAYMSVLMGLFMVVLEIMMHDHQYSVFSSNLYIIFAVLLVLFIYLYRKQVAIDDRQYLEGMIEHHSMALLTSEAILKKTDSYDVSKIAKNIIQTQTDELRDMHQLLSK
jgi:Ca2+/Na+ antiporter